MALIDTVMATLHLVVGGLWTGSVLFFALAVLAESDRAHNNGKCFKKKASGNLAYRINLDSLTSTFQDHINGKQSCLIKEDIGDFIIWRKDNIPSYHFATVVGDNLLGINNIVRGEDLLQSTFCQIFIMNKLNKSFDG